MTAKSVRQILWRFVVATLALIGAFFVSWYGLSMILHYSSGDVGAPPLLRSVLLLAPFMIVAAIYTCVYTWWKQRRKLRNDHTF
jgi:hypothetical protein